MKIKRRKPNRMKDYNYSQDGYYFITVCTKDREEFFGEIVDGEMRLNEVGEIVLKNFREMDGYFDDIFVDKYIVMPMLFGGVSLGKIIRHFKAKATLEIRRRGCNDFSWQRSFCDYIIRNQESLNRLRQRVQRNPKFWEEDRNKIENIFIERICVLHLPNFKYHKKQINP